MTARLDAIGLVVADMARSLSFYRRLGWDIPAEMDAEEHVEHVLPGGYSIMWDLPSVMTAFDPAWQPASGPPRVSLAFACDDVSDVDRTYADMTGAGFAGHLEPFDAFWGQRYASLRDPDGNTVDLYAPLAEPPG